MSGFFRNCRARISIEYIEGAEWASLANTPVQRDIVTEESIHFNSSGSIRIYLADPVDKRWPYPKGLHSPVKEVMVYPVKSFFLVQKDESSG